MRCNTIFRLLSSGHIAKVDPPEFQTSPHTVYYTNQETVQLKAYKSYMAGPHTATEWQIWSGPAGTGTLLFDSQEDTSDLQSTTINFPITYPSIVYMRARQWAVSKESDWSDDLVLSFEYCAPYASSTGVGVYVPTISGNVQNWGAFMKSHGIWVNYTGDNDVLGGTWVSISRTISIPAGTYFCQLNSDNHGEVYIDGVKVLSSDRFDSPDSLTTTISNTASGSTNHTFTLRAQNNISDGTSWTDNPAGIAFVMYQGTDTSGTIVVDTANWPNNPDVLVKYCPGQSELSISDGLCHCYTSSEIPS